MGGRIALWLLAAGFAGSTAAQTVWKCPDGYGQQPCPGGERIAIQPAEPTAAERASAQAATRRDAALAAALEKDRLRMEAQAAAYQPPRSAEPAPTFEPRKSPEKAATRKLDVFTASDPQSVAQAKKKKASNTAAKSRAAGPQAQRGVARAAARS